MIVINIVKLIYYYNAGNMKSNSRSIDKSLVLIFYVSKVKVKIFAIVIVIIIIKLLYYLV